MDKKFAIFDMDGTLVDSMYYWSSLAREYLESRGIKEGLEEVLYLIKPMILRETAALFVERFKLPVPPEAVEAEMNAMMEAHYRKDVFLKNGVPAYLRKLSERGVVMCVVSSTKKELIHTCLERLGIAHHFAFILSCEEVGAGKNRPDAYYAAAERMGALPGETAVFEDVLFALQTARDAGFYAVGVYDENAKDHWEEIRALADECIEDWAAE